jgi:hypothetical protein
MPSITELRYAGRHIIDYLSYGIINSKHKPEQTVREEFLFRVIEHTFRAKQDALEAIVSHAHDLIKKKIQNTDFFFGRRGSV